MKYIYRERERSVRDDDLLRENILHRRNLQGIRLLLDLLLRLNILHDLTIPENRNSPSWVRDGDFVSTIVVRHAVRSKDPKP